MADNKPGGFDPAHLTYLEQRLPELHAECDDRFRAVGQQLGFSLSADDVTPELLAIIFAGVAALLRQSGHSELADRYQAAYRREQKALREQIQLVQCAQIRALTDAEYARLATLAHEADAAGEQFDHVCADVSAFFQSSGDAGRS
jgi:hypothetical protein